jgi:hypothetical protein
MELEYNYLPSPFQVGKMASRRKCWISYRIRKVLDLQK